MSDTQDHQTDLLEPDEIDLSEVQVRHPKLDLGKLEKLMEEPSGPRSLSDTFTFYDRDELIRVFNESIGFMPSAGAIVDFSAKNDGGYIIMAKQTAKDYFANRRLIEKVEVNGKEVEKVIPAFDVWMRSEDRRIITDVRFEAPHFTETLTPARFIGDGKTLNTWAGYAVKPEQGETEPFWHHVEHVLCAGDAECFEYVRKWLIKSIQYPTTPMIAALVFIGEPGTGKSIIGEHLTRLYRPENATVLEGAGELVSEFNTVAEAKAFLFADEVRPLRNDQQGKLKQLLSSRRVRVNTKGIRQYDAETGVSLMMAADQEQAVAVDAGDRRFPVFEVSDIHKGDQAYFKALVDWFKTGLSALLYEALYESEDYGDWAADKNIPITAIRAEQIRSSLRHHQQGLVSIVEEARINYSRPSKKTKDGSVWVRMSSLAKQINGNSDRKMTTDKVLLKEMRALGYEYRIFNGYGMFSIPRPDIFAYDLSNRYGFRIQAGADSWTNDLPSTGHSKLSDRF
jgi:ABC-type oligopeptide transport system ATPase subunit